MKNTPPFQIVFQVLQVILINICRISHQIFYFLLFYVSFYISRHIFYKLLELHSSLSVKKIFVTNLSFLTDSPKPLHPPNSQNLLSMTKVFCQCSLIAFFSEQEPGWSILPNGAKLLRLAHEPSQNLIRISIYNIAIRRYDNPKNFSS